MIYLRCPYIDNSNWRWWWWKVGEVVEAVPKLIIQVEIIPAKMFQLFGLSHWFIL